MRRNALAVGSPERTVHQADRALTGALDQERHARVAVHADELAVRDQQAHRLDLLDLHADLGFVGANARELAVGRASLGADEAVADVDRIDEGVGWMFVGCWSG